LLATVYYLEDGLRASHRFVWGCVMRVGNKISFPPYLLLVQEPLSAQLQIRIESELRSVLANIAFKKSRKDLAILFKFFSVLLH
jgi:hypothetical protein